MAKDNNLQDFLTDVANAIREKKGTSELINPQDFSAEIESIQTGGSKIDYNDPVSLYKTTRNPDFLNMMGTGFGENYEEMAQYFETHDNEIKILFHLQPPADNLLAFYCVTGNKGTHNVSYTKANGEVVSIDNSGYSYLNLDYKDFANEIEMVNDEIGTGTRQVIITIKPTNADDYLDRFLFTSHPDRVDSLTGGYSSWNVIEIMSKWTSISSFTLNGSAGDYEWYTLGRLQYLTIFGDFTVTRNYPNFNNLLSLKVINLNFDGIPDLTYYKQFQNCYSLLHVVPAMLETTTNYFGQWNNNNFTHIPYIDIPNFNSQLRLGMCKGIRSIGKINSPKCTNIYFTQTNMPSLQRIESLDITSVTTANIGSYNLQSIKFTSQNGTCAGANFSFLNAMLSYEAIIEMLESLPTPTSTGKTITLTNNLGTAQLSAEVTAGTPPQAYTNAVNKGWTIVL